MQKFWSLLLALAVTVGAPSVYAQSSKAMDMGIIDVVGSNAISVRVSGATPELNQLALMAFNTHGGFSVNNSTAPKFDIRFAAAGANQVNVQISRAGAVAVNQTVNGTSLRNALFRAADVAVAATTKLPGYFASKLAFVSTRTGNEEIYVGDLFFGEIRQITSDGKHKMTPRWSPDGRRLLYTSFAKGFPDIYQVDLASMQLTTFVSVQGTNSGARFSPQGDRVAMVLSGFGHPEICVAPASGRPISRLTNSDVVKSSPCFSPDGSRIIYAAEPGPQLYVMSSRGGAGQRVTRGASGYCAEPDWSRADPNKIAFTFAQGRTFQVGVLDLSTGQTKVASKRVPLDAVEPCWLADGRHLVYTARAAGSRTLFILDTESGRSTRIGSIAAEKGSVVAP